MLDYDDLLLYWGELMQVPELAADVGALFDHVLVDEYQDTNALQASILRGLKPDGAGLTVVGDDAQAIYGFRAATVRNILDFPSSSSRRPRSCGWSRTTARPSRSSPPPTPSSGLPASSSPRTCARTEARASRPALVSVARRHRPGRMRGRDRAGKPRGGHGAQGAGGAVPHLASQRHAGGRAGPPQHPLRQVRRSQVHRGGARQGHAGGAALGGEPGRPGDRLSRRAAAAGARPGNRRPRSSMPWPGDRPSMRWPRSARPPRRPSIGASWSR